MPAMTAAMSAADLAVIEGHLRADGIFTAHARTDVLALLAEVRRLRHALTVARVELDRHHTTTGPPVATSNGAPA
ncbi:MAG: hypothetical protein DLM59_15905 [Pseudonocardiales bacterium]|nr:MAG: hypothetical protein DLM59_15905 [Pseudonocardiales bacterium]